MKSFQEIIEMLSEAKSDIDEYKIYKVKNILWIAYAEGSGKAVPIGSKSYITDKPGDSNYDYDLIKNILKAIKYIDPVQKKKSSAMYDMPIYTSDSNLSIWGGSNKPQKVGAFIVATGAITVVTFFESKNEAKAWMKTTTN